MKGNQFKEDYADIDKEIDDAMQIVQLGIGSEVMKQNNQLLQQTKLQDRLQKQEQADILL